MRIPGLLLLEIGAGPRRVSRLGRRLRRGKFQAAAFWPPNRLL